MYSKAPDPERVAEILALPTCSVVQASYVLGIGRDGAYEAARRGQIRTLDFGERSLRVPTAWLKKVLAGEAAA